MEIDLDDFYVALERENYFFTKFDLTEAFYHLILKPKDSLLFVGCYMGLYFKLNRLPMGFTNAPSMLQKIANRIKLWLGHNIPKSIDQSFNPSLHVYLDDFLIGERRINYLRKFTNYVGKKLIDWGINVNLKKSTLEPAK